MSNQPLKLNTTRNIVLAVLGIMMILDLVIVLWLVVLSGPTFTFMRTEELKITSVTFPSSSSVVISVTYMKAGGGFTTSPADFSPILIASLIAIFATVALVANKLYNQTSPAAQPLKPPPILTRRNIITAVLVVVIILSSITALYLLYEYLFPPPVFVLIKTEEPRVMGFAFPLSRSNAVRISSVTIDDVLKTPTYGGSIGTDGTLLEGESGTITISNWTWVSGHKYTFAIITASGNKYTYITTARP